MDEKGRQFYQDFDHYIAWAMESSPVMATALGAHDYDDLLADHSLAAEDERYRRSRDYLAKFERALDVDDKDARVDAAVAVSMVRSGIRAYERIQHRFRMPDMYLGECVYGAYVLLAKEFAPLPERARNLAARLAAVPAVLDQGKRNLERPPRIWTEIAMEHARGGVEFFERTVPAVAEQVPEQGSALLQSSETAARAVKDYIRFLDEDLLPRSDGDFAIGEDLWNEIARDEHMLDADAGEIERTGHRLIDETRQAMAEVAGRIAPGRDTMEVLEDLSKEHPEPNVLLHAYREAMLASRQFVVDRDLVTVPDGEWLAMQDTPAFARETTPYAAYVSPGPFEKEQQGIFWVTPVNPNLPADERETRLRGHPTSKIAVTAVHEGYPGHHLQLVLANHAATLPRKLGDSTLFVEGWAFYCEEMMEQQGFLTGLAGKLGRLADQLWRACRIVIDVGLHTKGMTVDQGVDMLAKLAGLERPHARAEVRRYTQSPTQPMCYLIGKLELLKVADEYRARKGPSFSLKSFHDDLLSFGSLAPKLLRTMLFVKE